MTTTPPSAERPVTFPHGADLPLDRIVYGPDVPDEAQLRLLGDLQGKRVLQLGAGTGHTTVALHRLGARAIVVEPSAERLTAAQALLEREEVRTEAHQADLADLAGVRAESIDLVISVYALAGVDDLPRVFRQVHRVLRPEHPLVFSLPHPAFALVDPTSGDPLVVRRSYWDQTPRAWAHGEREGIDHTHTLGQVFTGLTRSNFLVDTLHEPEPPSTGARSALWSEAMRSIPSTLVIRARKQGF